MALTGFGFFWFAITLFDFRPVTGSLSGEAADLLTDDELT